MNTALLIIDVQRELFEKSTPIYQTDVLLENICALIERARNAGVPIFFIQHSSEKILLRGTEGWLLHPRLQPQPIDKIIEKHHGNAFEKTELKTELDALGIQKLVLAGLVTHGCVKATCLGALKLGYDVILARDAHSNFSPKAADLIAEWNKKLSQAGATLLKTQEIEFLLAHA